MRALMKLAKEKQTTGMLPICEDMISKVCASVEGWRLHDTCKILL
jgi:inositol polyphosphate-4-phosphatase